MSAAAKDKLLDATAVTKRFGGLTAVNAVDFSIPRKSIVALIGPNGAGKTTFFNILTGLYKPTEGKVFFDGSNITAGRPDKIMSLGVARTFQNIRLFGTMTAAENVMVGQHARMHAGLFGCTTSSRRTSPTATSAGWRSRARSRPSRSCSCSTSRRPG